MRHFLVSLAGLTTAGLVAAGCAGVSPDEATTASQTAAAGIEAPLQDGVPMFTLETDRLTAGVTPAFGGRIASLSLRGRDSVIAFDEEVARADTAPQIRADGEHVGVLGSIVWVGPQEDWWNRQSLNPARAGEQWPPDPWLVLSPMTVTAADGAGVTMTGPDSPVSGVAITKTVSLDETDPRALEVNASIENVTDASFSWDIWFNTRVVGAADIYVPVTGEDAVYPSDMGAGGPEFDRPTYDIDDGLFRLAREGDNAGRDGQRGKLMIDPSAGWMAAFHDGQAFIITFDRAPKDQIHPSQAQVEIYVSRIADDPDGSFIEMEHHAPFGAIAPGSTMSASERWLVLPYAGPDTQAAHAAFLNQVPALSGL